MGGLVLLVLAVVAVVSSLPDIVRYMHMRDM